MTMHHFHGDLTFNPVPAAAEAAALPLVLPEPRGDPGGDGVRTHLLETQGPG